MKPSSLPDLRTVVSLIIIICVFSVSAHAQYCTPAPIIGCITGDYPSAFSMTGTSISINDPSLTCTGTGYEDRTATDTCAVVSPSTVNCSITSNTASTYVGYTTFSPTPSGYASSPVYHGPITESCQLWVDWNNNGVFDASEVIGGTAPLPNSPLAFTVNIPSSITSGYYRMRLVVSQGAAYSSMDPCMVSAPPLSLPYSTGDAIDYTILVGVPCTTPTVTLGATTCTSQVVNWTAIAGSPGYEYVVNTSAAAPTSGPYTGTTATTFTASSLTAGTAYYAHVRDSCGVGSLSSWVNIPFTTSGPGPITGTAATCPTSSTLLSDAVAGGTWSSSATSIATIASGGVTVYGVATGTTNITYTVGGCTAVITVTVAPLPAPTGTTTVCPGSTTQLSDAVPGGTWSSGTPAVATVSGTGLVYGATTGTSTITYSAHGCTSTVVVTVSALPAITGGNSVCVGSTLALSDATAGGVWSSSNTALATVSATGVVTGVAVGSPTITYTQGGCNTTLAITVGSSLGTISGTTTFCVTSSTTLSDTSPGGVWSSSNTSVATVSGSVTVHGVGSGTATISYTAGGCSSTTVVTVVPNNAGTITGSNIICIGPTPTYLSDAQAGGTWSSGTVSRATVNATTGAVYGVSTGTDIITYTVTNVCGTFSTTYTVHVYTAAQCLAGIKPVTEGQNADLKVFPNPNGGTFTMNLVSDNDEEVHVMITNIIGQKVKEFVTTTNKAVEIQLNRTAGIYLISATTAHGNYISKVEINTQ